MPIFGVNTQSTSTGRRRSGREANQINVVSPRVVRNNRPSSLLVDDQLADLLGLSESGGRNRLRINELFDGFSPSFDAGTFFNQGFVDQLTSQVAESVRQQQSNLDFGGIGALGPSRSAGSSVAAGAAAAAVGGLTGGATGGSRRDASALRSFQIGLRQQESGANYSAVGPATRFGTAKGAYQFIDSTWRSAAAAAGFNQYPTALDAPPEVQDQVAANYMSRLFSRYGDWGLVAIAWHAGEGTANRAARTGSAGSANDGLINTNDYARNVLSLAGLR